MQTRNDIYINLRVVKKMDKCYYQNHPNRALLTNIIPHPPKISKTQPKSFIQPNNYFNSKNIKTIKHHNNNFKFNTVNINTESNSKKILLSQKFNIRQKNKLILIEIKYSIEELSQKDYIVALAKIVE